MSSSGTRTYGPLIAGCLLPLLLALVCQAYFTVSVERRAMVRGLENKASSLATMMVNITGPSLVVDDLDGVKEGLAYLQHDADIAFAAVVAPDGQVLASAGGDVAKFTASLGGALENREAVMHGPDLVLASSPVRNRARWLGTVVVGLGTANIDEAVHSMIVPAVGIALGGIAAAIAVVVFLSGALFRRNRDLKILMDNAEQGFMRVDLHGTLLPEHSAVLETWFGPWKERQRVWDYMGGSAPQAAEWMQLMWENIENDVMPVEVSLEQLPHDITTDDRSFKVAYKLIERTRGPRNIMLIVTDVTAELAQERAKVQQGEMLALFTALQRDRAAVEDFFAETGPLVRAMLEALGGQDLTLLQRQVHTVKGNCATFGFVGMAQLCHDIEDHFAEGRDCLSEAERAAVRTAWGRAESMLRLLSSDDAKALIEIEPFEQTRLLQMLEQGAPQGEVTNLVRGWQHRSARRILSRFAHQAQDVARRLGKGEVRTTVNADGVRIPEAALAPFWGAFGHAITNAIDHGLETGEERVRQGKNYNGTVTLTAEERDGQLVVALEDDGRGIDWEKLARKARDAGLPHASREDLLRVMYDGGVSTKDGVTETSGRGIGMSAVHAACVKTGGTVRVFSEPARGTRFVFSWPARTLSR